MELVGLRIRQWHPEWDKVVFDEEQRRRRPDREFYLFSISASRLRALCGIQRRSVEDGRARSEDIGIQRRHETARSDEIREFVRFGFPWSEMSQSKRESGLYENLRMPGWLPTAIVVNILTRDDSRLGKTVADDDIVRVIQNADGKTVTIKLPSQFSDRGWKPRGLHPIEVIDGQHRLWAFEGASDVDEYELPVVAFRGLDIAWQAYLFWTVNIKPKRINPSLAFDLYPLLRTQDWLDSFHGHSIYRETRAQELTEALWSHPKSPWYHRINMLGEPGGPRLVTQAAWIRSLMATFVKRWDASGNTIGGLFGAPIGSPEAETLPWTRTQQAAFLIFMTSTLADAIAAVDEPWTRALRTQPPLPLGEGITDPAFAGPHTLLNTDQGIRGLLYVVNDLCYIRAEDLELSSWVIDSDGDAIGEDEINRALESLEEQERVARFIRKLAGRLAEFDWRTSSAPDLSWEQQRIRSGYRGSGGYRNLRIDLLRHLAVGDGPVTEAARAVLERIGDG